jgi:FxsC-like protein
MGYWFFVSYARQDSEGDGKLKQFYDDLLNEVLLFEHFPDGEAGFFDVEGIEFGAPWKEELSRALRTSRVMLSLCSPAYFNSDYCGKEFQVFYERQKAYTRAQKPEEMPHLILPILWGPPNKGYPELIQNLQYTDPEFPAVYAEQGLKYMMDLSEHGDDYIKFRRRLARIIIEEGRRHALPELKTLRPLEGVRSAFAPTRARAHKPGGGPAAGGFKKVWVMCVAARPDELSGFKAAVEAYGDNGRMEWKPYMPPVDKTIGVLAQEAVSKQKLFYYPLELETTDDLVEAVREAERNGEIVIILVDAWTMRIAAYRDFLTPYDKVNLSNCSVLIPWNERDPEAGGHRVELEKAIKETFQFTAKFKRNSIYYRDSITSDRALKETLMKTLSKIRAELTESTDAPQEPIQDEHLAAQAREKGIEIETLSTVQSPGGSSA